jgi:hypothetical protein
MAYSAHEIGSGAIKVTTTPKTFSIAENKGNLLLLINQSNSIPVQYELDNGPVTLTMYSAWPPTDSETGRSPVVPPGRQVPEDPTGRTHITVATPSGQAFLLVIDADAHSRR